MRHPQLHKAMWLYWEGGLSIIPINAQTKRPYSRLLPQAHDKDGNPLFYTKSDDGTLKVTTEPTRIKKATWEPYQQERATADTIEYWIRNGVSSVAVIGGMVSGGLEILDFDVPGYYEQWIDIVAQDADDLPTQRTGGGGIQIAWRCPEPEPNQKLAWHPDDNNHSGRIVAIETRGVNGYALLPPSLHPSGRYYELLSGRFSQVPTIEQSHRDFLVTCAKSLCQAPKTRQEIENEQNPRPAKQDYDGDSVIDAFNTAYTVDAMLQRYQYTRLGNGRYSRPGKANSAGVVILENGKSYHMSSNDPLDSDARGLHQPRSAFDFYLTYEHNGSYTDAVREAAKMLGMNRRKYPVVYKARP